MLKRVLPIYILIICLLLSLSVAVYAIDIDGYPGNKEWAISAMYFLNDQKDFMNEVEYAVVNIYYDSEINGLYVLVRCEFRPNTTFDKAEVRFSVNDDEPTVVNYNNEVLESPYECVTATQANAVTGFAYTETLCRIKEGLDLPIDIVLSIVDGKGTQSNLYTLTYGEEPTQSKNESDNSKTAVNAKTKTTKTEKTTATKAKKTTTAFTYKKATATAAQAEDLDEESTTKKSENTENLSSEIYGSGSSENTPIIFVGSVCALAVVAAAAYSAIKSNKLNQDNDEKRK